MLGRQEAASGLHGLEGYQGMLARKDRMDVPSQRDLKLAHQWLVQIHGQPDKAVAANGKIRPASAMRTGFSAEMLSWRRETAVLNQSVIRPRSGS